jgi:Tfp pilus assembly protein PilN
MLLGLIPAYMSLSTQQAYTDAAEDSLVQAQAGLAQMEIDQSELQSLEQRILEARTLISRLLAESGSLGQGRAPRSEGIEAIIAAQIPRVSITTISQEEHIFSLTGQAGSQALVLDYARALQGSGQFANVRIISMVNADPLGVAPEVTFSITMEQ